MATAKPTETPTPKLRAKPVPSPEFAAARALRDLRVLDERKASLDATYKEKAEALATQRAVLVADLTKHRAAFEKLMPAPELPE